MRDTIDWSVWRRKLGKKPDAVLAKEIGCCTSSVSHMRWKLGIKAFHCEKQVKAKNSQKVTRERRYFRPGKTYYFKSTGKFKSSVEKGRTDIDSVRFCFLRTIEGNGTEIHLFCSERGRYCETFTEWQLRDYDVKEAA